MGTIYKRFFLLVKQDQLFSSTNPDFLYISYTIFDFNLSILTRIFKKAFQGYPKVFIQQELLILYDYN